MSDKFFIPDLMQYLQSYIKGCHICQLSNKDKIPNRHFLRRIKLNYKPLSRLSMDLKVMPKSYRGHRFILCVIDEMTNYLITMPIYQGGSIIHTSWPNYKRIISTYNNNIPVNIPIHPYVLLDRNILCNCDIQAENNILLESLACMWRTWET